MRQDYFLRLILMDEVTRLEKIYIFLRTNVSYTLCFPPPPTHSNIQGSTAPSRSRPSCCLGFTITLRHTTFGWTPLDEWSARRKDLYLTKHNTHNRQASMHPEGLRDSNPQSQQASGRRFKPYNARSLGSALSIHTLPIILSFESAQQNKQNFRAHKFSMAKLHCEKLG